MEKNITYLPYRFTPYKYQWETFDALFNKGYRNFIDIEHRRAGKDKKWINIIIAASQIKVGLYLYCLPTYRQAKDVIWKGRGDDGIRFMDHVPKQLIKSISNVDLTITLTNGSVLKLAGADNYDRLVGINPLFVVYSEYSLIDPNASEYFRPIFSQNKGTQAFVYTPRGKNHAYYLWETNKDNPDWFCQQLTVDKTVNNEGLPIISKEAIEKDKLSGMSEELIEQEYYCSFNAALEGAYFSKGLRKARNEGRIVDFPIDTNLPVNTYWDLGHRDKTAIWFIQLIKGNNEYRVINFYENSQQKINHYINYLQDFRQRTGIVYGTHYAPHDVTNESLHADSCYQIAQRLGIPFQRVPKVSNKIDAIEAARAAIDKCYFNEQFCEKGLGCLASYHSEFNSKRQSHGQPVHDWSSHAADAFMQFAQSYKKLRTNNGQILYNRVNNSPLFGGS